MRVALAQICTSRDVEDNLRLVADRVREAADAGAELVVFPEATMRAFGHNLTEIAERIDESFATRVQQIAADAGVTVVAGMFTPGSEGRVHNTLLIASADDREQYDKLHLYDAFGFSESDTIEPGEGIVQHQMGEATLGLATCYDVRFPQLFIDLAREGADVMVIPASWGAGPGKVEQWRVLARARALDSVSYVLACGQADPEAAGVDARPGAPTGVGRSMVISPFGEVLAEAGPGPELLVADLDLSVVEEARRTLPVLENAKLS